MKKLLISLLFVSTGALASNCKVTTVVVENDGKVDSQTATICKEGNRVQPKTQIGDVVLESELSQNPKVKEYFKYKNSRCRMFIEHGVRNKEVAVYHGVMCQADDSETNWVVVDKW
jgi:hypothetical protein